MSSLADSAGVNLGVPDASAGIQLFEYNNGGYKSLATGELVSEDQIDGIVTEQLGLPPRPAQDEAGAWRDQEGNVLLQHMVDRSFAEHYFAREAAKDGDPAGAPQNLTNEIISQLSNGKMSWEMQRDSQGKLSPYSYEELAAIRYLAAEMGLKISEAGIEAKPLTFFDKVSMSKKETGRSVYTANMEIAPFTKEELPPVPDRGEPWRDYQGNELTGTELDRLKTSHFLAGLNAEGAQKFMKTVAERLVMGVVSLPRSEGADQEEMLAAARQVIRCMGRELDKFEVTTDKFRFAPGKDTPAYKASVLDKKFAPTAVPDHSLTVAPVQASDEIAMEEAG